MVPIALTFLIVFAAGYVQSVTGFGFALLAVPLLAVVTTPATAVVTAVIVNLTQTAVTAAVDREYVQRRLAGALMLTAAVGMPFGLLVLKLTPPPALTAIIATVTLGCTLWVWRGPRLRLSAIGIGAAGVLSGVLATATGTNGPPLVAALQTAELPPREFRATIATIFTMGGVISIALFALGDELTGRVARAVLVGLPAAAMGGWSGNLLFRRMNPDRFRRLVLAGLGLSSLVALTRALTG